MAEPHRFRLTPLGRRVAAQNKYSRPSQRLYKSEQRHRRAKGQIGKMHSHTNIASVIHHVSCAVHDSWLLTLNSGCQESRALLDVFGNAANRSHSSPLIHKLGAEDCIAAQSGFARNAALGCSAAALSRRKTPLQFFA